MFDVTLCEGAVVSTNILLVIAFVLNIDVDTMKPIPFERALKTDIFGFTIGIPSSLLQLQSIFNVRTMGKKIVAEVTISWYPFMRVECLIF